MPVRCVVGGCINIITHAISLHPWLKDEKNTAIMTKLVHNTSADFTGPSQYAAPNEANTSRKHTTIPPFCYEIKQMDFNGST